MVSQIILVTGDNSGIGYETVKVFFEAEKPYHILLGSKSLDKAKQGIKKLRVECPDDTNTVEPVHIDITSDESIETAFAKVQSDNGLIDVLINNAGPSFDPEYLAGRLSLGECFTKAYDVNVAGTNVLTTTLIPMLFKSSNPRLTVVAGLSHINQAGEAYLKKINFEIVGYRCSKTALNMLMLDWNHKLEADGVKVRCVEPGFLATNLGGMTEEVKKMGRNTPVFVGE